MAKYKKKLSNLVDDDDMDKTVIIKGELIFSHLRKRMKRSGWQNNPDYYAWVVGLGNPEIVKGDDTNLAKYLSDVDLTSRSFHTANDDSDYDTTFFIESKSNRGIPIVDGKTKQSMPGDELLEAELANGQPVSIALHMHDTGKGNPALLLDAVEIEDANNIKYYDGSNAFANAFGKPTEDAKPLKAAKNQGKDDTTEPEEDQESASADAGDEEIDQQKINDMFG